MDGGLNTYGYVDANPIRWTDPLGQAKHDPNSMHCRNLLKKIQNVGNDLDTRYLELAINKNILPERIGPGESLYETRRGHQTLINKGERNLRRLEDKYLDECGGPPPNPAPQEESSCGENCKKVATVVVGAGAAYIAYRCIRFLPSLYPPLWPTIPANLATP